jgi:hypothetical protein
MLASRIKLDSQAKAILDDSTETSIKNLVPVLPNDIPCFPLRSVDTMKLETPFAAHRSWLFGQNLVN